MFNREKAIQELVSVFIVRAQNRKEPESYLAGVYPTKELALARCEVLEQDYECSFYDEVMVSADGADCSIPNM